MAVPNNLNKSGKKVSTSVKKPIAKSVKPVSKTVNKSVSKPIAKSVKPVSKPISKPMKKPVGKSVSKPILKPASSPVSKSSVSQSVKKSDSANTEKKLGNSPDIINTSIPQLDNLLNGGIVKGTTSCIWVKPGSDGTPFVHQIANSASKNKKVFYIINSKDPESSKQEMKELGINPSKINFVDSYSKLVGKKTNSKLSVSNPKDLNEIYNDVSVIVKNVKDAFIIIDSLSTLIDLTEKENTEFLTKLKGLKATILCLFTEWPYEEKFIKSLKDSFDNIVELSAIEEKIFFRQYFSVSKVKNGKLVNQAIPYRIVKPEGIKIYIPKVLVTGPFNAGKSSFIHSASEKSVSVDRLGTTIALDHGHVKYKDFAVDLFGTPGQQRFDPILKLLGGEALGVILMVSAIDSQTYARAIEMMKKAKVYGLPVVFAANKSNLRGALKPEQIKKRMNLTDEEVIPLVAKDLTKVQPGIPCQLKKEDIEKVLDSLFSRLLKRGLKK
jgi:uncharacterized protein